jgi:hypothetical protein
MVIVPDHAAAETLLEEVPLPCPALVEALRVEAAKPVHARRHRLPLRLDQEMEVRVEQAPGVHAPAEHLLDAAEQEAEPQPIAIVSTNPVVADGVHRDVEDAVVWELGARHARHDEIDGSRPQQRR